MYIGLGANLGDRELALLRAVAELGKIAGVKVTAISSFYQSEPVGGVTQPNFYNAVVRLATTLSPLELLDALKRVEVEAFGRVPSVHWGPRSMDLDILIFGAVIFTGDRLTIPHPRLAERRFVLMPLAEIAPDLMHPLLGKSMAELLAAVEGPEKVERV